MQIMFLGLSVPGTLLVHLMGTQSTMNLNHSLVQNTGNSWCQHAQSAAVRSLFHFLSSVSPLSSARFVISAVRQAGKLSHSCRQRANAAYAVVRQAARLPALFAARP